MDDVGDDVRFWGRDRELAGLLAAFDSARSGRMGAIFLTGDAGVGKTCLVSELACHAARLQAVVLIGHAIDICDAPPYWPMVSAVRRAARSGVDDEVHSLMLRWLNDLGTPSGIDDPDPRPPVLLLDLLHQLIVDLADKRPVLLVIEDLQWADRSTRDLLVYLVANLSHEAVLIVGTYRNDSPGRPTDLTATIAELRRHRKVSGMEVEPLPRETLAGLVAAWAPERSGLEPLVWQRSKGNIFIAEETVRAVLDGDALGLPVTLRELVQSRVAMLSPSAAQVVRATASSVGPLSHSLLLEVVGQRDAVLLEAVREAVALGILVVDEHGDGYQLRHGLFTEVVAADVLPGERIDLHRRYACALYGRRDPATPGVAARLAHHWYEAGDHKRALVASVTAAQGSERIHAYAEAHAHWVRAAELAARITRGPVVVERSNCLDRAARAADLAGDHERAMELLERLLCEHEPADELGTALITARKGSSLAAAGRIRESGQAYRAASALLPKAGAEPERARVLAGYSTALLQNMDFVAARAVASEALELARGSQASVTEAKVLAVLGFSLAYLEESSASSSALAEALAVAERSGEPEVIGEAYQRRAELLAGPLNQMIEGIECARRGVDRMRSLGLERTAGVALLTHIADALFRLGRWDEAQQEVAQAWTLGPTGARALEVRLTRSRIDLGRGRLGAAEEDLDAVGLLSRSAIGPGHQIPLLTLRAGLELWREQPSAAFRHVEEGLAVVEAGADDIWSVAPLVWHGTRAWAEATRLAVDEPSARQLQRLRRHSAELAHRATGAVAGADAVVATFALMCAAETARAENRPDPEAWRRVVELWERHSQPYPAAYARLRFAEALLINRSRSAAASNALRGAEREARRLGARPLLGQIVELAIRARVTLDRASEKSVPQPHGEQHGPLDALTTRELEVLTELASGRSDREIGNRLFISEKTVGVHVSRIFTKIGVHSRVQASAVLHNHPGT